MTPPRAAVLLAGLVLLLHLPFLPVSLEDLDSINFALGVRQFDVAQHQPHPPGYPVYIGVARVVHAVAGDETRTLALISVFSGALTAAGLVVLYGRRRRAEDPAWFAAATALLVTVSPLFAMTAARPLSDMFGLAMVVIAQVLTLAVSGPVSLAVAAFVAAVGVGVRSQVVWLTLPLLVYAVVTRPREERWRGARLATLAYAAGALLWFVPLVILSGGPAAYLQALASQGGEDFAGVAMLAMQPSPRLLVSALYNTWIAPWGHWGLAIIVLAAAIVGALRTLRQAPSDLAWLLAGFAPYAIFHLVFQETVTTRYALPLVLPVAFLAVRGFARLPSGVAIAVVALSALGAALIWQPALRAYGQAPAPAFQVLYDFAAARTASGAAEPAPVLAMHRRQELDMRRPLAWQAASVPAWSADLPAPPKHEWLELVKYWNSGGRAPIWFLADPPRSDLRLIDPHALVRKGAYRWPFDAATLLGGVRPNVMDWYEIAAPGWYAGEGWALTPETAGVARDEGKGPGRAPIQAWVRRSTEPVTLMIGGRKLTGAEPTSVSVAIDGRPIWDGRVAPGFFLQFVPLPAGTLAGGGDYAELTVKSGTDEVAIEQFDIQPVARTVYGYGDGWQELEYNPATGRLWRWSTERAQVRIVSPRRPLTLHLEGEFETSASTAHVTIRAGDRVIGERDVPRAFVTDIPIPADVVADLGETVLTIESDQWYVPAETNWRPTQDRRHLALRLFACELR